MTPNSRFLTDVKLRQRSAQSVLRRLLGTLDGMSTALLVSAIAA
jgi:hypothetical protein